MIKLSIFEFFCRGIPEAFVFVLASLIFTKKIIDKKKLVISSILYAIVAYLVRLLPIHFGVHSIIIMMIYVVISILINNISISKSIFYVLIEFIVLLNCELANMLILHWMNVDISVIVESPPKKVLYFLPSLILFIIEMILFYIVIDKIRKKYSYYISSFYNV